MKRTTIATTIALVLFKSSIQAAIACTDCPIPIPQCPPPEFIGPTIGCIPR